MVVKKFKKCRILPFRVVQGGPASPQNSPGHRRGAILSVPIIGKSLCAELRSRNETYRQLQSTPLGLGNPENLCCGACSPRQGYCKLCEMPSIILRLYKVFGYLGFEASAGISNYPCFVTFREESAFGR